MKSLMLFALFFITQTQVWSFGWDVVKGYDADNACTFYARSEYPDPKSATYKDDLNTFFNWANAHKIDPQAIEFLKVKDNDNKLVNLESPQPLYPTNLKIEAMSENTVRLSFQIAQNDLRWGGALDKLLVADRLILETKDLAVANHFINRANYSGARIYDYSFENFCIDANKKLVYYGIYQQRSKGGFSIHRIR